MDKLRYTAKLYVGDRYYSGIYDHEVTDLDHYNLCMDLESLYYQLSNEEIEILKNIRNKYL